MINKTSDEVFLITKVKIGEIKNLRREYQDYLECNDEISFEEYLKQLLEEWNSKVGGTIDNYCYLSMSRVEYQYVDSDGNAITPTYDWKEFWN